MTHRFVIADVFTQTAFGGNQLAVFSDARGLSGRAMQARAREFNFAETTFVLPPEDPRHTRRVRIFTPQTEVPFAGHPTVGTAAALARLGLVEVPDGATTIRVCEESWEAPTFHRPCHDHRLEGDWHVSSGTIEKGEVRFSMISKAMAPHYVWGDRCDGWRLVQPDSLSVIHERMPPHTAEYILMLGTNDRNDMR